MRRRVIAAWVLFACTIGLAIVWVVGVTSSPRGAELQFLLPTLGGALLGLDQFAGSLQDRVGSQEVVDGSVGVVSETMQPVSVAVWMRET
ncbi:MAG: hypothetical protein ACRDX9_17220 [Acidimicrobiia bacterium]